MASTSTSRLTALVVSASVLASSVTSGFISYVSGNQKVTGYQTVGLVTTTDVGSATCMRVGTSSYYDCYQEVPLAASGSKTLRADWRVPTGFSSGALLTKVTVEANTVPVATSGALVLQTGLKLPKTTGTTLRNNIAFSTGSITLVNTGTVITTKIPTGQYVNYITSNSGGSAIFTPDAKVRYWFNAKYGR